MKKSVLPWRHVLRTPFLQQSAAGRRVVIVALFLIVLQVAPVFGAGRSAVGMALDSAVRIEVSLRWTDQTEIAEFSGSGWTRACHASDAEFVLVIATAGHVIDIAALEQEARPGVHAEALVKVVVMYRDGRQLTAGREALRVDRVHDYGEIRLVSSFARLTLPTGGAASVAPGAHLFSIASPGLLTYVYLDGRLTARSAVLVSNAPEGAWLSSMPVAPGASGAPVMTDDGRVVASVIGYVEWPWGGSASIVVALPASLFSDGSNPEREDVKPMNVLETLVPLAKLGVMGAGAGLMLHVLGALTRRGALSPDSLAMVSDICRKVVLAVEQSHPSLAGADKKQIAEEMIGQILSRLGIQVPRALIEACVESAVMLANALSREDTSPPGTSGGAH